MFGSFCNMTVTIIILLLQSCARCKVLYVLKYKTRIYIYDTYWNCAVYILNYTWIVENIPDRQVHNKIL